MIRLVVRENVRNRHRPYVAPWHYGSPGQFVGPEPWADDTLAGAVALMVVQNRERWVQEGWTQVTLEDMGRGKMVWEQNLRGPEAISLEGLYPELCQLFRAYAGTIQQKGGNG